MLVAFRDLRLNFPRLKAVVMPGQQSATRRHQKDNRADDDDAPGVR